MILLTAHQQAQSGENSILGNQEVVNVLQNLVCQEAEVRDPYAEMMSIPSLQVALGQPEANPVPASTATTVPPPPLIANNLNLLTNTQTLTELLGSIQSDMSTPPPPPPPAQQSLLPPPSQSLVTPPSLTTPPQPILPPPPLPPPHTGPPPNTIQATQSLHLPPPTPSTQGLLPNPPPADFSCPPPPFPSLPPFLAPPRPPIPYVAPPQMALYMNPTLLSSYQQMLVPAMYLPPNQPFLPAPQVNMSELSSLIPGLPPPPLPCYPPAGQLNLPPPTPTTSISMGSVPPNLMATSTPNSLKRKVPPGPEDSPDGLYIGQHSQGLGGHYADSYWAKKRLKRFYE